MTDKNDHQKDCNPHDKSPSEGLQPTVALFWGLYLGVIFTLLVALVLSGEGVFRWTFWGGEEPNRSAILRNLGLVAIGVIGLPLAVWRGITAFQQAEAANKQAMTANRQANLAEKGQIIDRYQKGAQMLESDELAVRMAGVFALRELAISEPGEMYVLVMELLTEYLRNGSKSRKKLGAENDKVASFEPLRGDFHQALKAISKLQDHGFFEQIYSKGNCLDLSGANLSGVSLSGANLRFTNLQEAVFQNSRIGRTDFYGSDLSFSKFFGCEIYHSNMENTYLLKTHFRETSIFDLNITDAFCMETTFEDNNIQLLHYISSGDRPAFLPPDIASIVVERYPEETNSAFQKRQKQRLRLAKRPPLSQHPE